MNKPSRTKQCRRQFWQFHIWRTFQFATAFGVIAASIAGACDASPPLFYFWIGSLLGMILYVVLSWYVFREGRKISRDLENCDGD